MTNCKHLLDHRKSKRIPEKTSISASLIMLKPLWGSQQTVENFLKRPPYLPPAKPDSNCQHLLDHTKSKRITEKHLFLLY